MADPRANGAPPELIYVPEPSWYPALIAFGLAAVVGSLFTWWPYGVIGGLVALFALVGWIREARESFVRMPRRQRLTAAVIPAETLKRPE
jgi:membrane-associated phospholipid phosphatase